MKKNVKILLILVGTAISLIVATSAAFSIYVYTVLPSPSELFESTSSKVEIVRNTNSSDQISDTVRDQKVTDTDPETTFPSVSSMPVKKPKKNFRGYYNTPDNELSELGRSQKARIEQGFKEIKNRLLDTAKYETKVCSNFKSKEILNTTKKNYSAFKSYLYSASGNQPNDPLTEAYFTPIAHVIKKTSFGDLIELFWEDMHDIVFYGTPSDQLKISNLSKFRAYSKVVEVIYEIHDIREELEFVSELSRLLMIMGKAVRANPKLAYNQDFQDLCEKIENNLNQEFYVNIDSLALEINNLFSYLKIHPNLFLSPTDTEPVNLDILQGNLKFGWLMQKREDRSPSNKE